MLGKTHLAIGMAAALALIRPDTPAECFTALISGAVGGVLADMDTIRTDRRKGATQVHTFAAVMTAALLMLDSVLDTGLCAEIAQQNFNTIVAGTILFALLWVFGLCSDHRSFSHSLCAVCLFTWAVNMICPQMSRAFLTAYASHLVLDLLNKRSLKLFYPLDNGICFGVFYSNRKANKIFLYAGCLISAFFIIRVWIPMI